MADNQIFLTIEGKKKFQEELDFLQKQKRPQLVERLANARSSGDLKENAEYHHAREELSFMDGRIEELEDILSSAKVIKKDGKTCHQVSLGSKVIAESDGKETTFYVVGDWEADPTSAKISHSSPLGKALIGRKIGEKVVFEAPVGKITYTILAIE